MSRVVFVLGAGASKECGAPVMGDFLDVAADLYHAGAVKDSREHFERVFDTIGKLQAVHSKAQLDLTNIESVFTAFELGQVIQRLPGLEAVEITQAIVSLKKVILETLQTTIKFPTRDRYIEAPTPYAKFAQLLNYLENEASPTVTVSVVTFNYDIALDLALCRANLGPDYIIEPAPNKYRQVSLMKLHGSLNWSSLVVDREIRPLHFFDYLQVFSAPGFDKHSECTIPIGSQLKSYF